MIRIKKLVCPHESDEVLSVAEIDDIMRPAGFHIDALDLVPAHFVLFNLAILQIPHLDEAVTVDNDEDFPFRLMPVLSFGDARLADVDAHLSVVERSD